MTEVITTFLITVSSVILFGYWFRYTCMLILSAKTVRDYTSDVATANQLGFIEVQTRLQGEVTNLDGLRAALDQDYATVQRLLKQTANLREGGSLERIMLRTHYRVAGLWYRCSSSFAPSAARRALEEMSLVVAHFANTMGEQMAAAA